MHYITDVDRLMFAYERLGDGQELDWRGFWEGRISCKRVVAPAPRAARPAPQLLDRRRDGLAARAAGLRVIYDASARQRHGAPASTSTAFCDRTEAKGRAHAIIAALHPGTEIARALQLDEAVAYWEEHGAEEAELRRRVAALEDAAAEADEASVSELHAAYRKLFRLLHAKGVAETTGDVELAVEGRSLEPR